MPIALQAERLEQALRGHGITRFAVSTPDLHDLEGVARDNALDAIAAGEPSPFVLVDDRIVCTGAVDADAVLGAFSSAAG